MSENPIIFLIAYFVMVVAYGFIILKFWRQYQQLPDGLFLGFAGCLSLGGLTGLITTFWMPALSPILTLFQLFAMTFLFLAMLNQTKQWRLWPIPVVLTAVVTLLNLAIFDLEDSVTVMSVFLALMLLTLPAIGMAFYLAKCNSSKYLLSIGLGMSILIVGGIVEQSVADPTLAKNLYGCLIIAATLTTVYGLLGAMRRSNMPIAAPGD